MPPVVYSGSLERIDFGEEHETKGFVIGSIDIEKDNPSERTTRFEFIPVAARPFVTIEVEIDHATSPTDQIIAGIAKKDTRDAVVRVFYTMTTETEERVDVERIRLALADAFYIASIQPRIRPKDRLRRTGITEDIALGEALQRYIENNEHLSERKDDLLMKARELERILELGNEETVP